MPAPWRFEFYLAAWQPALVAGSAVLGACLTAHPRSVAVLRGRGAWHTFALSSILPPSSPHRSLSRFTSRCKLAFADCSAEIVVARRCDGTAFRYHRCLARCASFAPHTFFSDASTACLSCSASKSRCISVRRFSPSSNAAFACDTLVRRGRMSSRIFTNIAM